MKHKISRNSKSSSSKHLWRPSASSRIGPCLNGMQDASQNDTSLNALHRHNKLQDAWAAYEHHVQGDTQQVGCKAVLTLLHAAYEASG